MTNVTIPADPRTLTAPPARTFEPSISRPRMSNPMPIAFALFAFALAIYGVRFADVNATTVKAGPASEALIYAVLAAGVAQLAAGLLGVIRGQAFQAYVTATFGIWLLGLYLLFTQGVHDKAFTPDAVAWYVLALLVPVCILAVPEIVHRNTPFVIAFVALILLLLLLGLAYRDLNADLVSATATKHPPDLSTVVNLLKLSAYAAFIAAAAIWYVMARDVYRITGVTGVTGVTGTVPPYEAR